MWNALIPSLLLCDRIDFSAVFVVAAHGTVLEKVSVYLCYCFKSKRIFHHIMTFSPSMLMNFILPGSSLTIEIKCQLRPLRAERKFISHHEDYKLSFRIFEENRKTERAIMNKFTIYPFLFSPLWIYKMTKEDWQSHSETHFVRIRLFYRKRKFCSFSYGPQIKKNHKISKIIEVVHSTCALYIPSVLKPYDRFMWRTNWKMYC